MKLWKQVVLTAVVSIASSLGTLLAVAVWARQSLQVRLDLTDQRARVVIPQPVDVTADLTSKVDVALDTLVSTEVPLDQHFQIPLDQTISAEASIDHDVPVKTNVHVKQVLPLDTAFNVDTVVSTTVLGKFVDVPIKAWIPVKTKVPIDVVVPIDQKIPLKFSVPVTAHVKQNFDIPLKLQVSARVPVKANVDLPVISGLKARAYLSQEPVEAVVQQTNVKLPLRNITLEPAAKK
jgi:hypothetical protein